jgi:hypothetical protein
VGPEESGEIEAEIANYQVEPLPRFTLRCRSVSDRICGAKRGRSCFATRPGRHALVMTGPFSSSHKDTIAVSSNDIQTPPERN